MVKERLGRSLGTVETRIANEIEGIYAKYGDSKRIASYALGSLLGSRNRSWSYEMHEVWPSPPEDVWKAWLYLAALLRQCDVPLPRFLESITPREEVDALIAERERKEAIEQWREQLRAAAEMSRLHEAWRVELRVVLHEVEAQLEWRPLSGAAFQPLKSRRFSELQVEWRSGHLHLDDASTALWIPFTQNVANEPAIRYSSPYAQLILNPVVRNMQIADRVLTSQGVPFERSAMPLQWQLVPAGPDYELRLVKADGSAPPPVLIALSGNPTLYITAEAIFPGPPLGKLSVDPARPNRIPAPALESSEGVAVLDHLGVPLPTEIAKKTRDIKVRLTFECTLASERNSEILQLRIKAHYGDTGRSQVYDSAGWQGKGVGRANKSVVERVDRSAMSLAPIAVETLTANWNRLQECWERKVGAKFPQQFAAWLAGLPPDIEVLLDPLLASLGRAPLTASVRLDVEPSGVDWFDLRVALQVSDTELTQAELALLLDAKGEFVRLGAKGWQRLLLALSPEEEAQMADMGLSARDFSSKPQRFHALQLANKAASRLLPENQAAAIQRRAAEIETRVTPAVPEAIEAELRPYQIAGFHFLAYLATNRFGGILADDMGLGKTLQTLTWLAWLHAEAKGKAGPSLVVCPKSVMDGWQSESARFLPSLRVCRWQGVEPERLKETLRKCDLLVINYAQLRNLEEVLNRVQWFAVILDEAQFIKNPESQTAHAACNLKATHRLALSGTPIENRLLDLWSIMMFTMPGVLGARAEFNRRFDQRNDPLASRRLAARVRPFVLRRTKSEVAADLPDRIEEDIFCELEGTQATLYQAELKSARQHLLKLKTARDLDKARFNVLTSLLRLRQICCHPSLVNVKSAESAKLNALFDLLEPIMEEGSKVLVFSQFVEMLALIEKGIQERGWRHFILTGQTEARGELVESFQQCEEPAVFLISLRAGGFGLTLTAASYVVLFDPWWNPAAENQAIDRTHRIGQTNKVIAYRLLVKTTIEEKIRALQLQKSALASDLLGGDSFAKALTMEDFQFLLA
ncbi:MAG: DEAD/DEAH box helicase [Verrucomicrobiota bacterium]